MSEKKFYDIKKDVIQKEIIEKLRKEITVLIKENEELRKKITELEMKNEKR